MVLIRRSALAIKKGERTICWLNSLDDSSKLETRPQTEPTTKQQFDTESIIQTQRFVLNEYVAQPVVMQRIATSFSRLVTMGTSPYPIVPIVMTDLRRVKCF